MFDVYLWCYYRECAPIYFGITLFSNKLSLLVHLQIFYLNIQLCGDAGCYIIFREHYSRAHNICHIQTVSKIYGCTRELYIYLRYISHHLHANDSIRAALCNRCVYNGPSLGFHQTKETVIAKYAIQSQIFWHYNNAYYWLWYKNSKFKTW